MQKKQEEQNGGAGSHETAAFSPREEAVACALIKFLPKGICSRNRTPPKNAGMHIVAKQEQLPRKKKRHKPTDKHTTRQRFDTATITTIRKDITPCALGRGLGYMICHERRAQSRERGQKRETERATEERTHAPAFVLQNVRQSQQANIETATERRKKGGRDTTVNSFFRTANKQNTKTNGPSPALQHHHSQQNAKPQLAVPDVLLSNQS